MQVSEDLVAEHAFGDGSNDAGAAAAVLAVEHIESKERLSNCAHVMAQSGVLALGDAVLGTFSSPRALGSRL